MDKQYTVAYNKVLFRWMVGFPLAFVPLLIAVDPPLIEPALRKSYVWGRAASEIYFLWLFLASFRNQKSWHLNAFYIGLNFHAIFGQYFLPCYYLAYMEAVFPVALFLPLSAKSFYSITSAGLVLMLISINNGSSYNGTDPAMIKKFYFDASMGVLITSLLSILGYHFVTRVRKEKDILAAKFLDIGQNASSIIHDFKGLLTTPQMYAQMLEANVQQYDEKTSKIVTLLNEDMNYLSKYVHETNHLNNLKDYKDVFYLSEVIDSLLVIIKGKLRGVVVQAKTNPKLCLSKNLLLKVLYNLFVNSIEANNEHVVSAGHESKPLEIVVDFDPDKATLLVEDNGVGIPQDLLKRLNSFSSVESTKQQGSGVGTFMIKELISSIGGKVVFSNKKAGGTSVQIRLPEKSIIKE